MKAPPQAAGIPSRCTEAQRPHLLAGAAAGLRLSDGCRVVIQVAAQRQHRLHIPALPRCLSIPLKVLRLLLRRCSRYVLLCQPLGLQQRYRGSDLALLSEVPACLPAVPMVTVIRRLASE